MITNNVKGKLQLDLQTFHKILEITPVPSFQKILLNLKLQSYHSFRKQFNHITCRGHKLSFIWKATIKRPL